MIALRLNIRYRERGLLPSLLLVLLALTVLMSTSVLKEAQARAASPVALTRAILGVRRYYLSADIVLGNQVTNACAPGYHTASVWEIADPSGLRYETSLGLTSPDSGSGPPVAIKFFGEVDNVVGWVRTGYTQSSNEPPGHANCNGWLSNDPFAWGTVAGLPSDWLAADKDVGIWDVGVRTCNFSLPVWCVQDDSVLLGYLPLILR